MGECVKLPMRTKFNKARESNSTDPLVSKQWVEKVIDSNNYKKVIENWRNNKF